MDYNLLVEPWIPVLMNDGVYERVSIKTAFSKAGRIRQIAASNPMDRLAIFRFLLTLLYWCKGNPNPNEWDVIADSFPADWFAKLDDNKECFNLLGCGKRFYQDKTAQRKCGTTELLQEIPTGNNFWHFRHSIDEVNGLCPACCAMGLMRLPLFSVSGLPDLKAGINGTPPVYILPCGISLLQTLKINWKPHINLGVPTWDQPDIQPQYGDDVPLLRGLTLLSRRVLLHEPDEQTGSCIGCGLKNTTLIHSCEFQSAGSQKNDKWNDPHVVYLVKESRKSLVAPDLRGAGKFRMDRPWTDLLSNIDFSTNPFSLFVVGFATNKALNVDVWERNLFFKSTTLKGEKAASLLEQWKKEGGAFVRKVQSTEENKLKQKRNEALFTSQIAALRPHIEGSVSARVDELITGNEDAWEKASNEYRPMMEAVAKSLSPGFTMSAVKRRREIERIKPDMRLKPEPAKKAGQKKGDKI